MSNSINLREFKTIKERRKAIEKALKIPLENIGCYSLNEEVASTRNCENMIGVSQIPMGVAGPIKLITHNSQPITCFIPLVTTEGALIASVNRGCKAVSESGGATVFVEKVGITRGPVFKTKSLSDSFKLKTWLDDHFNDLNQLACQTSSHLKLKKIETKIVGRNVFVRFYFDTCQAMGMNMATIATSTLVAFIKEETGSRCLSLTGNFCVDKKASWLNFLLGRGRKVWAEARISRRVVKEVLKTTPEKIYEVWLAKCMLGSAVSGSLGFNAHFGNTIAAIFAATGQDLAHITEGSLGITTVEVMDADLYISIYLPDLIIGTVGGGTGLATQKEAMSIIFGEEEPKVESFAGVIGGAVLAGELSLLSSLAEGSLARAHMKLSRGGKPSFAKASGGRGA